MELGFGKIILIFRAQAEFSSGKSAILTKRKQVKAECLQYWAGPKENQLPAGWLYSKVLHVCWVQEHAMHHPQ